MRKKPLSKDEKRDRMLRLFHENKEFYNLKDLERLCPKQGIVLQTVKEVLDDLISDNLVEGDKIGAGNFFWSLPSSAYNTLQRKITEYDENIKKTEEGIESLKNDLKNAKKGREETKERQEKLAKYQKLKESLDKKMQTIDVYRRNDPERLKELEREAEKNKELANKWTENIFTVKYWMKNRNPGISESDINQMFEIPDDMDTL